MHLLHCALNTLRLSSIVGSNALVLFLVCSHLSHSVALSSHDQDVQLPRCRWVTSDHGQRDARRPCAAPHQSDGACASLFRQVYHCSQTTGLTRHRSILQLLSWFANRSSLVGLDIRLRVRLPCQRRIAIGSCSTHGQVLIPSRSVLLVGSRRVLCAFEVSSLFSAERLYPSVVAETHNARMTDVRIVAVNARRVPHARHTGQCGREEGSSAEDWKHGKMM